MIVVRILAQAYFACVDVYFFMTCRLGRGIIAVFLVALVWYAALCKTKPAYLRDAKQRTESLMSAALWSAFLTLTAIHAIVIVLTASKILLILCLASETLSYHAVKLALALQKETHNAPRHSL